MKIFLTYTELYPVYYITNNSGHKIKVPFYKKLWWNLVEIWFTNMQDSMTSYMDHYWDKT